ncbi:hypothetical protein BUE76_01920 [Cnuella takakiae]|nr:hypothetical protein BUE76_01920 [Cnuella takakiae]
MFAVCAPCSLINALLDSVPVGLLLPFIKFGDTASFVLVPFIQFNPACHKARLTSLNLSTQTNADENYHAILVPLAPMQ